jgi:UDP-glucose 4-epimerase
MKIVVFGGSGFLGSHVADALAEAGHTVTIYDRNPPAQEANNRAFIPGDILDEAKVASALKGQEIAYNFAGLADLDTAQEQPVETVRTNVLGNVILLEQARKAKIRRYVFASTLYVAGQSGGFYRASKQACELYVEEYQRWFGLDYTLLRYGSIYGRRADLGNGVRSYLTQALRKRHILVNGTGDELREYVHATDVAHSSVKVLSPEFRNRQVILTGHHPLRVRDLIEMIREIVGSDVTVEYRSIDPTQQAQGTTPHYTITPYSFRPQLAKKLVNHHYVDLGTGLMDCLEELHTPQEV